jgi:hypothetical protein
MSEQEALQSAKPENKMIVVPEWKENIEKSESQPENTGYEIGSDDDPFGVGKEIIVSRGANKETGAPAYADGGWEIFDDNAYVESPEGSGKFLAAVKVKKMIDGVDSEKTITLDKVYILNPQVEALPTPEIAEKSPLSDVQENIADEAIEDALGIEDPANVETVDRKGIDELRTREAAERVMGEATPKSPEQAAYDAVKQEMGDLVAGLSDMDKHYLDEYANAGPKDYNRQGVLVTKMSSELLQNSDLIRKYQELYNRRYNR